jgi:hypothetical protein
MYLWKLKTIYPKYVPKYALRKMQMYKFLYKNKPNKKEVEG